MNFNEFSDSIAVAVAVIAGIITFLVTFQVLKAHSILKFPGVIAFCVAALGVLGILDTGKKGVISFILIPYAAMAITFLVLLLLRFIARDKSPDPLGAKKSPVPQDAPCRRRNNDQSKNTHQQ